MCDKIKLIYNFITYENNKLVFFFVYLRINQLIRVEKWVNITSQKRRKKRLLTEAW